MLYRLKHTNANKGNLNRLLYTLIVVFVLFNLSHTYPLFSDNSSFQLFSWKRKKTDQYNYGYNLIVRTGSITENKDSLVVNGTIRVNGLPKWYELVADSSGLLKVSFKGSKPSQIVNCSSAFHSCSWLKEYTLNLEKETHTIRFFFPLPDAQKPYRKFDYFSINVNDSILLQFQCIDDSLFMGSFLNKKRWNEPDKRLMAKGAIMVRTSEKSPFKISSVELNAAYKNLITQYLGYDLSNLSNDCDFYGLDFTSSSVVIENIKVGNIQIQNASVLKVDSTYTITWKTDDKASIKVCSLYVKFNKDSKWYPIAKTAGNTEQTNWLIPDNGDTQCKIIVCAVSNSGKRVCDSSAVYTITKTSSFELHGTALSTTSVYLTWTPQLINTANANALVVAYRADAPVLTYPSAGANTSQYDLKQNSDTIANLKAGSLIYFAAFIKKTDGSFVSAGQYAFDSVRIADRTPPQNTLELTALADSAQVKLSWVANLPLSKDADSIGIFMCEFHYPVSYDDPDSKLIKRLPVKDSVYMVTDLKKDKTYYFALMVKDSSGNWSEPTEKSIVKTRLSAVSTVNAVTIPPTGVQKLFNDSLHIWNTSELTFIDTVDRWEGPFKGFVAISKGFVFRNGDRISKPLWVEVTIPSGIKSDKALKTLLYTYDIYKGGWFVSYDTVRVDTVKSIVSARNSALSMPFMFLIDTVPPVVKISGKNSTPVSSGDRIKDTIFVTDNIKNFTSQFFASPGDASPWDLSMYITAVDTTKTPQIYTLTTPPGIANECTGFRAVVKISDIVHEITANLSKPVIRKNQNCDNLFTQPLQWTPILVSAQPDYPELSSVMKSSLDKSSWAYDTNELRIIKWMPGNKAAFDGGWVQYGTIEDSLFRCKTGSLLWVKTKSRVDIDFGSAVVPALKDSLLMQIPAERWTDFSNPFPFDIYIGDILKASKNAADSLEIYSWNENEGIYQTEQLYLADMPGLHSQTDTIKGMKPYAIYNPGKKAVTLRIPPVCIPSSALAKKEEQLSKKSNSKKQWSIRVDSWGTRHDVLQSVYCGYNPMLSKDVFYHTSPTFSRQFVSVYDQTNNKKWGSIVSSQQSDCGAFFELLFENNSTEPVIIRSLVTNWYGIDNSQLIKWFDLEKNVWIDIRDTVKTSLKQKQNRTQIVAVGTEQYFKDLGPKLYKNVLSLHSIFPNPFRRSFMIQYTLPYNTEKVSFMVFNLRGQLLWKKEVLDLRPGPSSLRMERMLATGIYILQMRVKEQDTESPKLLNRKVMCVN